MVLIKRSLINEEDGPAMLVIRYQRVFGRIFVSPFDFLSRIYNIWYVCDGQFFEILIVFYTIIFCLFVD